MKKIQFLFVLLISSFFVTAQIVTTSLEETGSWDDDSLPTHSFGTFNDCWGYAANDREYAIIGSASYIHILDVTDPTNPVLIDQILGGAQTVWRDFKTYDHYLYCVADNSGEGLIIIDLSDLPNTVTKIYQSDDFFGSSHNIYIDQAAGRLYSEDGSILDLTVTPEAPTLMANFNVAGNGMHDLFVQDNIAYYSSGNSGLFIYDMTDPTNPVFLSSLETNGYNHSNWISEDGATLIVAEEVPLGLPLLTIDLAGVMDNDISVVTDFQYPNIMDASIGDDKPTPHNPYILGDKVYVSYYEDGVHVYDWSDPANPEKIAVYDTYPENDDVNSDLYGYNGYAGCWGVYPFLPSGYIIASDMDHGLSMLKLTETVSTNNLPEGIEQFDLYPTPVNDLLTIELNTTTANEVNLILTDISGRVVLEKSVEATGVIQQQIDMAPFVSGMYFLQLNNGIQQVSKKVIKL